MPTIINITSIFQKHTFSIVIRALYVHFRKFVVTTLFKQYHSTLHSTTKQGVTTVRLPECMHLQHINIWNVSSVIIL